MRGKQRALGAGRFGEGAERGVRAEGTWQRRGGEGAAEARGFRGARARGGVEVTS